MATLKLATVLSTMAAISRCLALPVSEIPAVEASPLDVISVTMWKDINWSGSGIGFSITTQSQCC